MEIRYKKNASCYFKHFLLMILIVNAWLFDLFTTLLFQLQMQDIDCNVEGMYMF